MLSSELYNYFKESSSVSTDTRLINKGSIFFALKGENFDGNKFAEEAIKSGASYAVIDDQSLNNPKFIKVKNVLKSLQDLSKFHRSKLLKTKIIALTGSNGKTTTKELISEVLKKKYKIISTIGNLNNHIGVPLTLLRIKQNTEIAIVEMGANHLNEIKLLTDIINPDFGLITNFGKAHLEGFGSIEGVIKGKSELYDFLIKNDKKAFINNDDYIQNQFIGNKISFSKEDKSNYIFKEVKDTNYAGLNYNDFIVDSKLTGNYNYHNIAFATSIGLYFNISIEKIKEAISNYIPSNNRSQIIKKNNKLIILDAYNANPTSMISAINSLIKKQGNKSVILGDMFELGNQSEKEHHDLIDFCVKNNFENIFLIGNEFFKQKDKFEIPFFYKTKDELNKHIKKFPITSKYILIKGSRVMRMENLINFI
ncbi:MAG: UDP-N-acetylmuramoyl-tripeptide--D-alanyl-D-alanine ligase [Flavobacteriaceae bacterium]|nr:UDP-N-acetylmuramoyl-tripeptide--D-alanyl-D-alanine ligase [Flavobacteriaceae bacterium]